VYAPADTRSKPVIHPIQGTWVWAKEGEVCIDSQEHQYPSHGLGESNSCHQSFQAGEQVRPPEDICPE
jgi:hypothetical protein